MLQKINEFATATQDPCVQVINQSSFTASFLIEYYIGNSRFRFMSNPLIRPDISQTNIPADATKISVTVYWVLGQNMVKGIFLKTLNTATNLKLLVTGTEKAPLCQDITNPLTPHLPIIPYILVANNASYTATLAIRYTLNNKTITAPKQIILGGHTGITDIPTTAINILLTIQISDKTTPAITLYTNKLATAITLKVSLSGTITKPVYTELISLNTTNTQMPALQLNKVPDKDMYYVGDIVTFEITISNLDTGTASNVVLTDNIPNEATFILTSLTLDNNSVSGDDFLDNGLDVGDMNFGDSHTVTYQMTINSMPNANPVKNDPVINYDYINTDGANQIGTVTGVTTPFTVVQGESCNCCCCCCCPCMFNCPSISSDCYNQYVEYLKSLGCI